MMKIVVLVLLAIAACQAEGMNQLVTIGILSQPASDFLKTQYYHPSELWTFVAGSYVDWVGTGGAMPVLIPYDLERSKLLNILENIDGMLFPGGAAILKKRADETKPSSYQDTADFVYRWSMEQNNKGRYFPIWATCLGWENLLISEAGKTSALECDLEDEHTSHSVEFTPELDRSDFYKEVGLDRTKAVWKTNAMYYTHSCGIRASSFHANSQLSAGFKLLGTSKNAKGVEFVASVEHKKYPFWATQWHPEKNMFERAEAYSFLDRSGTTLELMHSIINTFTQDIRLKGAPKTWKDIKEEIKMYFAIYRPAEIPPLNTYERIYTFQRYHNFE